ncbi:alpha/beta fold hydrolase (plasmid) [Rhizobium lusitanum]|nr:alpha/beta fold hydrolase [Rhizobium lusitanum]QND46707.1 alpha/beta fold hydrolase [Rhizobium lusitanum]
MKRFSLFLIMAMLTSCASRPGPDVLETVSKAPATTNTITVYSATTRPRKDPAQNIFTSGRSISTNYAQFTISIPPTHKSGQIEWPHPKPDPQKTFAVTGQAVLNRESFLKAIPEKDQQRRVVVFVHGYNYNFQEALFRLAQLRADSNLPAVPILFAWPSQAALSGYIADKDSATFSRDNLTQLLIDLTKDRKRGEVMVFAHSMGGWLTTEALRQLKLEGRQDVLDKLTVVLAAPDIDADVFISQLNLIGKMSPPLTVLVSRDDRALEASTFLGGGVPRVGALDVRDEVVREAAVKAGVRLIDISALKSSDPGNHDRFIALASMNPNFDANTNGKTNMVGKTGAFVFDAIGATLSSPFRLASKVVNPQ